jgi:hypothetical protein
LLHHGERGSTNPSSATEAKTAGHGNVASDPHRAGATECLESNPTGVMLVKLLRSSRRLTHATVGKQVQRHAKHVEAGTEVGRRRRGPNETGRHESPAAA